MCLWLLTPYTGKGMQRWRLKSAVLEAATVDRVVSVPQRHLAVVVVVVLAFAPLPRPPDVLLAERHLLPLPEVKLPLLLPVAVFEAVQQAAGDERH